MTLVFRNPISNITVYPDDSVESNCFSMNFDSFLADVKVEETNPIDYSADGSVKVCESAGACSVTLVFDERSSNYPWLVTNVEGDDIGDIIVTGNDNGVTIAADNLNDITVTVSDFEIEKQIAFSTEESSVQIVDSKTGSPMVMIDKNRDGIYESELYEKGDSSNSAAPTYAPVIEQNVGGTISVNNKHPVKGECVSITPAPDAGYKVGKVIVTDKGGNEIKVTANEDGTFFYEQPFGRVTINVTFDLIAIPFTDVNKDGWFYEAVEYVFTNGFINGTSGVIQ